METISWTDRESNEEMLHSVKEERNIVHTVKGRKNNWIGHIVRRNCLIKQGTEGKIQNKDRSDGKTSKKK